MTLIDFLAKWGQEDNSLANVIFVGFGCDIRTFQKWKKETPRHTKLALAAIDKLWSQTGKNYQIFFEL